MNRQQRCFLALLTIFSCWFAQGVQAAPRILKVGTTLPANHPTAQSLYFLQKELQAASNGQLILQVFPDAQLGSAPELLNGVQFGSIEMAVLPSELLAARSPCLQAIFMPYLFKDQAHRFRVLDSPTGKALLDRLHDLNLFGIGFLDAGARHLLMRDTPVLALADLQGRKIGIIRLCPASECADLAVELSRKVIAALGAMPELVEAKQAGQLLREQSVQGVEQMLWTAGDFAANEAGKWSFSLDTHIALPDIFVASQKWFAALPPEQQAILQRSAAKMVRLQRELLVEYTQTALRELEGRGVAVQTIDQAAFRQAVQPMYDQMFEEFGEEFRQIVTSMSDVR